LWTTSFFLLFDTALSQVGADAERIAFIDIWWTAAGALRHRVNVVTSQGAIGVSKVLFLLASCADHWRHGFN
jgi:hypothetical protein